MEAAGVVAADVDGDGLPDLFLSNHVSPSRILKNLGHGKFRDVTEAWGLAGLSGPFTSAVFFDADRDGRVDLFVACYGDARVTGPAYDGRNGGGDRFFRNVERNGHPFFVDETAASGLGDVGWSLAAAACDADDDGDDDLYVANDFGKNGFFENRSTPGHPFFVNIARTNGTEDEGYGMGVAWGDYDGDGRWDLHVSDYWTPYRWILNDSRWPMPPLPGVGLVRPYMAKIMRRRSGGDALFRNLGGLKFARTSEAAGVVDGGWAWGTEFVDLDGKGREDLLVVNGMYRATTGVDDEISFWNAMGREGVNFHDGVWGGIDFGVNGMASRTPKRLFWNRGDGTFEERAFVEGFDTLEDTRGLAYADLDGDGAPEVLLSCSRWPLHLYRNAWGEGGGRVVVRLSADHGLNRDVLGAVVRLTVNGRVQLREVRAGSSFLSQSSHGLLFGLGGAKAADVIEVRWPDGRRDSLHDVPAGTLVTLVEGEERRESFLAIIPFNETVSLRTLPAVHCVAARRGPSLLVFLFSRNIFFSPVLPRAGVTHPDAAQRGARAARGGQAEGGPGDVREAGGRGAGGGAASRERCRRGFAPEGSSGRRRAPRQGARAGGPGGSPRDPRRPRERAESSRRRPGRPREGGGPRPARSRVALAVRAERRDGPVLLAGRKGRPEDAPRRDRRPLAFESAGAIEASRPSGGGRRRARAVEGCRRARPSRLGWRRTRASVSRGGQDAPRRRRHQGRDRQGPRPGERP